MSAVYYNDIDPYCCKVLRKNIDLGNLPEGYIDGRDIREVRASELVGYQHIHLFAGIGGIPLGFKWANVPEHISILTGGFPCQDISNAGKRAGITGSRSGLWSEMYRLICELRPKYILVENVAALLGRGIDTVLGDLASCGYDAEWQVLSAAQFGAPHLRRRVFIVAYASSTAARMEEYRSSGQERQSALTSQSTILRQAIRTASTKGFGTGSQNVAYPLSSRCTPTRHINYRQIFNGTHARWFQGADNIGRSGESRIPRWAVEPDILRVVNGIPARVDRLKALGNAIVPQIPEYIGRCIIAHAAEMERVA